MYKEDLALNNQTKQNHMYLYMYKKDLALNNLQWLICQTKENQIKYAIKLNQTKSYIFIYV